MGACRASASGRLTAARVVAQVAALALAALGAGAAPEGAAGDVRSRPVGPAPRGLALPVTASPIPRLGGLEHSGGGAGRRSETVFTGPALVEGVSSTQAAGGGAEGDQPLPPDQTWTIVAAVGGVLATAFLLVVCAGIYVRHCCFMKKHLITDSVKAKMLNSQVDRPIMGSEVRCTFGWNYASRLSIPAAVRVSSPRSACSMYNNYSAPSGAPSADNFKAISMPLPAPYGMKQHTLELERPASARSERAGRRSVGKEETLSVREVPVPAMCSSMDVESGSHLPAHVCQRVEDVSPTLQPSFHSLPDTTDSQVSVDESNDPELASLVYSLAGPAPQRIVF